MLECSTISRMWMHFLNFWRIYIPYLSYTIEKLKLTHVQVDIIWSLWGGIWYKNRQFESETFLPELIKSKHYIYISGIIYLIDSSRKFRVYGFKCRYMMIQSKKKVTFFSLWPNSPAPNGWIPSVKCVWHKTIIFFIRM